MSDIAIEHHFPALEQYIKERQLEVAWAAGIIDGEGCIRVSEGRSLNSYTLTVAVSMTCDVTIEKLRNLFRGGSVSRQLAKNQKNKDTFRITWCNRWAHLVLLDIEEFSVTKVEQVRLALDFFKWGADKFSVAHDLTEWKRVGWRFGKQIKFRTPKEITRDCIVEIDRRLLESESQIGAGAGI